METGSAVFIFIIIIGICYIIYDSRPSKYTKTGRKLWWIYG